MKRFLSAVAGVLCGAILGIACASFTPHREISIPLTVEQLAAPTTTANTAYVTIRNDNFNYVKVYLSENGNTPHRIASMETGTVQTVPFRVSDGTRYSFIILPLAGTEAYTTEGIAVMLGDTLRLSIADHLNFTNIIRSSR